MKLKLISLRLFDEGAAPGAAQSASGTEKVEAPVTGSNHQSKSEKVVYGKQDNDSPLAKDKPTTDTIVTNQPAEQRKAQFNQLITDYKDLYTEKFQSDFNNRFKEHKAMEAELEKHQKIANVLKARYNVDDIDKLETAISNDDQLWEDAADAEGLTVDQYKEKKRLENENEQFRLMQTKQQAEAEANKQYADWLNQAEALKNVYPGLDLSKECQNQDFLDLIMKGHPVDFAYRVCHFNEIMQDTAKTVQTNVVQNIRAQGLRPAENGMNNQPGVVVKSDVHNLTAKDRDEIAKRVAHGAQIAF